MQQCDTGAIDFQIRFLDNEGAVVQSMSVHAESLSVATSQAAEVAVELNAADFFITATPKIPPRYTPSPSSTLANLFGSLHRRSLPDVDAQPPAGIAL